ncbi:hypothetical protein FACS189475_00060 [Betaproteobacteria bacterium]|nr:hypothetical protein FACS189475_00060 [Betaproteobacteria bacterium]
MNNNRYRLVFNRVRGFLMAVAEFARALGKGVSERKAPSSPCFLGRLDPLAGSVLLALLMTASSANAQIVAYKAAPGNQQAIILNAPNGVPLVNIQTPSAAGVSRNAYSQFDVQGQGAILNNSRNNVQTQLGGWVQGNPWLATGTARVILNEILSSHPSQLLGYLEVGGDKAQVIIANPAGITCNGCGLINASRATFTTGVPILENGNLTGYRVESGRVRIEGAGMDMSRVDHTEILARAVEVNAGLWAQTLTVATGANRIDTAADTGEARLSTLTALTANTPAPAFAIDVAQLGGMYAQKIHLIGTEAGVGVRNAGDIGAAAGDVVLLADGTLTNKGRLNSAANIQLTTQGLDNSGEIEAPNDLTLTSAGSVGVINSGTLNAGRELTLSLDGLLDNRNGRLDGQRLDIRADSLANDGGTIRQTGLQSLTLEAQSLSNGQGGLIGHTVAGNSQSPTNSNNTGNTDTNPADNTGTPAGNIGTDTPSTPSALPVPSTLPDGIIAIGGSLGNASGIISASGHMEATATDGLQNSGTLRLDRLDVSGDRFDNTGGDIAVTDARIHTARLDNSGGALTVADTLDLAVRDLTNAQGELLHGGASDLAITLDGQLDNTQGRIATNATRFDLAASTLTNTGGALEQTSNGTFTLTAGQLNGIGGTIESLGTLLLSAQNAVLDKADTLADALTLTAGALSNRDGRIIQSGESLTRISIGSAFDNRGGTLATAGTLDLVAGAIANSGGQISADQNLTANALSNASGQFIAGQNLNLGATGIDNTGGTLGAIAGDLAAAVNGALDNSQGRIEAANTLTLDSQGLNNISGAVLGQTVAIDTHGQNLDNSNGQIFGQNAVGLDAGRLANIAGLIAGENLKLDADSLNNQSGRIVQTGQTDAQINITGALDNRGGALESTGALKLTAGGELDNSNGRIVADTDVTLTAASADNSGGLLSAAQTLNASITDTLRNASGQLIAGQNLNLSATGIDNTGGLLGAIAGDLAARVNGRLDNTAGRIEAADALTLDSQELTNISGSVLGQTAAIDTHGQNLDNSDGQIFGEDALTLNTGDLANTSGLITGQHLLINAGSLDNRNTQGANQGIEGGAVAITARTLDNQSGRIVQTGDGLTQVSLNGVFDNRSGLLATAGALDLAASEIANDNGQISAGQSLTANIAGALSNASGQLIAGPQSHRHRHRQHRRHPRRDCRRPCRQSERRARQHRWTHRSRECAYPRQSGTRQHKRLHARTNGCHRHSRTAPR